MAIGILFLVLKQITLLFCFVLLSTAIQPTDLPQQACVCTSQSPPCQPAFPARSAAPSVNDLITRPRPHCPKPVCGQGTAFFCPRFSPSAFPGQPPPPHLLALTKSALQCCSSSSSAPQLPLFPAAASAWACLASQLRRLNIIGKLLYFLLRHCKITPKTLYFAQKGPLLYKICDTQYEVLLLPLPGWPPG